MPAPERLPSPPSPPQADDPPKAGAADDSPTRVWFLGLTALGAAGLLGELSRRRLLQQRARRLGETIPMPGRHTAAATAERALRAAAVPVPIAAITTTLTNLAARRFDTDRDLPRIGALLLDEHTLTLLLTEDDDAPVAPFTATDPSKWVAAAADVVAEQPLDDADATNPYPLLVTLGHTDDATLIVNLEAAGTLAVVGDDHVADEVLHALVIEAATSDLCSQLAVVVDDELAELRDAFEPHRLRPSTHPDEMRATLDDVAQYLAAHEFDDTLQARGDRQAPDLWLPTTFIARDSHEACPPWRGAALVARAAPQPAGGWTIAVTADGTASLEPLGIGFAPQRLKQDNLQALRDLLTTAVPPVASRPNAPSAPPSATETIDTMRASAPRLQPPVDAPEQRATIALSGVPDSGVAPGPRSS
jgi:hypothetical protein